MTLDFGCNPNIGNVGKTLLNKACSKGNSSLIEALLKYMSPLTTDFNGDTVLHLVSKADLLVSVKYLLNANVPLLVRNNRGESPIDVAPVRGRCKPFLVKYLRENRGKIRKNYDNVLKQAKQKYSGLQHFSRLFVLGNPDAGKSSFIESLKREGFFESLSKVSESSVPTHTAGIIPSFHLSKIYGRVLFFDFAGDAEYYSSHAAILESLASSKKGNNIFIVVVNLSEDNITIESTLHYWFSFIEYQKFCNFSFVVVGSHLDSYVKDIDDVTAKSSILEKFCGVVQSKVHKSNYFMLDCRNPRSSQIAEFKRLISSWISESSQYEISKEASLLLRLLERDFSAVTACPVQKLATHIEDSGVCLPTVPKVLHQYILNLHEVGLLLSLGDSTKEYHHVILNITKLTNEVHRLLFSESALSDLTKMYPGLQSYLSIGVLPVSILEKILPPYITKECLIHLQYCQQISYDDIGVFASLQLQADNDNQSLLFFPALCSVDKSQVSWRESTSDCFHNGLLVLCTDSHDYFPPRFLHVLLLRLVYGLILSVPAELQSGCCCTMWKRGVHLLTEEGVDIMVELVSGSKGVVILTKSSQEREEICMNTFIKVIRSVMEAKADFCHSIKPQFFLLDTCTEADYMNLDHHFDLCEVERALKCPKRKNTIVSVSGKRMMELSKVQCMHNFTYWHILFPIEFKAVLDIVGVIIKEVTELGVGLSVPEDVLQALEVDFASDVSQWRREVVRWWMSFSPVPPCWWHLVQALQRIDKNSLAKAIRKNHG